jgi:hypothetical protein
VKGFVVGYALYVSAGYAGLALYTILFNSSGAPPSFVAALAFWLVSSFAGLVAHILTPEA